MIFKLLTEHHLEFLNLNGGCTGSSESTLVKMPHCWKSHAMAHFIHFIFQQVLLVASAFMSPLEARNNTNRNGVRMFGVDKFSKTVLSEKWDRVKIVCTQPFNKV